MEHPTKYDYHPKHGDSMSVVNGRLIIEFKARDIGWKNIPAGTLVCEPFTPEELEKWRESGIEDIDAGYPDHSTTVSGILFHTHGKFTPRES